MVGPAERCSAAVVGCPLAYLALRHNNTFHNSYLLYEHGCTWHSGVLYATVREIAWGTILTHQSIQNTRQTGQQEGRYHKKQTSTSTPNNNHVQSKRGYQYAKSNLSIPHINSIPFHPIVQIMITRLSHYTAVHIAEETKTKLHQEKCIERMN